MNNDTKHTKTARGIVRGHTDVHPAMRNELMGEILKERDNAYELLIQSRNAMEYELSFTAIVSPDVRRTVKLLNEFLGDRRVQAKQTEFDPAVA